MLMELRERNHRSRFTSRRSTKDRREYGDQPSKPSERERFSITDRVREPQVDHMHIIRKWTPWVIAAAILYWVVTTYVF
jgi:hypothetical protein